MEELLELSNNCNYELDTLIIYEPEPNETLLALLNKVSVLMNVSVTEIKGKRRFVNLVQARLIYTVVAVNLFNNQCSRYDEIMNVIDKNRADAYHYLKQYNNYVFSDKNDSIGMIKKVDYLISIFNIKKLTGK